MDTNITSRRFVVIGGVSAGINAAIAAKRSDPSLEVIVLEKGDFVSYNTCSLPYYISNVIDDYRLLIENTPAQLLEESQIEAWTKHKVMAIYPEQNELLALDKESGEEKRISYDSLMLATGGVPINPPVPGVDLPNIFQIRTLTDSLSLKQYISEHAPQKATIIGGGYIGLEMAEVCTRLGMEVAIVEKYGNLMGKMGPDISGLVEQHLQQKQIQVLKDAKLEAFEARDGICGYVQVNGQQLETDLVIVAIGIRPEIALARGAGLEIGDTGAIAVNAYGQSSIENIYAGGDCAEVTHIVSGEQVYLPLGTVACKQGRTAGKNVARPQSHFFKGVAGTMVTKAFDLEIARTGLSLMEARRLGFDADISTITADSRDRNYPGNTRITISIIWDQSEKRLLGAEMLGREGVAKRIDVFASALDNKMTIQAMTQLDLSYAPPYAPPWDPVLTAANVALKKLHNN